MRSSRSLYSYLIGALLALLPLSSAERMLQTSSLTTCQTNSSFSASLFDVTFTPNNGSLAFNIIGTSTIVGNVSIGLIVNAYGLQAYKTTLNPCNEGLQGMCPMNAGPININSQVTLPQSSVKEIPGITYSVPDLDATVKVYINDTDTQKTLACVQASLSNGKSVYLPAVCWVIAIICGLGLIIAAVASGMGHSNTAAHIAANTLALFGYFQAQAFIGMTSVHLPPIVASWTQDFQWSMGMIRVGFLQELATWYQRATGGTPSHVLSDLATTSVEVQKRSLDLVNKFLSRSYYALHDQLVKRVNAAGSTGTDTANIQVLRGIERVGFRARIEITNIFMTGYIFLLIFIIIVVISVLAFKFICDGLVKAGRMKGEKFIDFRNGWTTVMRGILFRVALIAFPQMVVLCFWEFTERDSGAEMALAVFTILTLLGVLGWAASKVIRLARRSINMHKNPAYVLYSDPATLNKWGFLYVQFKANSYYFIVVSLGYILVKGLFIGLGQKSGLVQAIGLLVSEAAYFITICILLPFMDKKTNAFNIAIMVVNFLNAIFLLMFTGVFGQPAIVTGAMGIIFFFINAVFSLVLLLMLLVASGFAIFSKNPDTRYQPMRDDRGSFIKSQTQLTTELDALGATARGEGNHSQWKGARIEDDDESISGSSTRLGGNSSSMAGRYNEQNIPHSPVNPSFHSYGDNNGRHESPGFMNEKVDYNVSYRPAPASPAQSRHGSGYGARTPQWQRGAGYE